MGGQKPHLLTGVRNNLGRRDPGHLRAVHPLLRRRRAGRHALGHPAALPGPGRRAHRDHRLDRPQPAGHAATPTTTATSTASSGSSAASAGSSSWDTEEFRARHRLRRRRRGELGPAVLVAAGAHPHLVPHRRLHRGQAVTQQYAGRVLDRAGPARPGAGRRRRRDAPAGHGRCRTAWTPSRCRRPTARSKGTRCGSRCTPRTAPPAAANPYTVTEQNFTIVRLQEHRAEPARGVPGPSARGAVLPLRARRGRPAGRPRADAGGRRTTATSCAASRSVIRAATGYAAPEPTLAAAVQQMLAYDQGRLHVRGTEHVVHQRRSTTWPPGPTPTAPRCPRTLLTAEITGVAPADQGHRDHEPVHLRRDRRAPAASGRRSGPARATSPTSRSPAPTSTAPAARPPRPPGPASGRPAALAVPQRRPDRAAAGRHVAAAGAGRASRTRPR